MHQKLENKPYFNDLRQIKWKNVNTYFEGCTKEFLEKIFNKLYTDAVNTMGTRNIPGNKLSFFI